MKFIKDDRYIEYQLVLDDKYPFTYEIKRKVLYLNVKHMYDEDEVNRYLNKEFDHLYLMINDKEYKKFYGKKNVVHYLGKTYYAKTKKATKNEVVIKGDTIVVYCKDDVISQHRAIYKKFLKNAVERTIVNCYYEAEYDFKEIKIPQIIVKGLRRLNCFGMNAGDKIYLEQDLGRYDEKYIKAVFYHELCHCFILEHNQAFYDLLNKKMKDGVKLDKEMDSIIYVDQF